MLDFACYMLFHSHNLPWAMQRKPTSFSGDASRAEDDPMFSIRSYWVDVHVIENCDGVGRVDFAIKHRNYDICYRPPL